MKKYLSRQKMWLNVMNNVKKKNVQKVPKNVRKPLLDISLYTVEKVQKKYKKTK